MVNSKQNGTTDFVICLRDTMKAIGKIGVWQDHEIGFLLARAHWRQGLACEALEGILPHLFEEMGFDHLTADIDPRNTASEALLKKVGFQDDGYKQNSMQVGGQWVDSQYLKLQRIEWRELHASFGLE
jgi:[ribosomal protein S5]-alanine N-acetyltransferase